VLVEAREKPKTVLARKILSTAYAPSWVSRCFSLAAERVGLFVDFDDEPALHQFVGRRQSSDAAPKIITLFPAMTLPRKMRR